MPKKIVVYLGSSEGNSPKFKRNAEELGGKLVKANFEIIYGGASVGTMRALADGALDAGGYVTGVFPKNFKGKKEVAAKGVEVRYNKLSKIIETDGLSDRIAKMEEMSDACVILPGSYGTMNELFIYLLNRQLAYHEKQIYVLNTDGYYNPLRDLISNMADNGFISRADGNLLVFCNEVDDIVSLLKNS